MRRLAAVLAALLLCSTPTFADVAVGNGSVGVPLTATQGGTGQTSYVTNCAVVASSSSALTCTLTPTLTGTNFSGIPNAAFSVTPETRTCSSWTPTDQSGAALSLTISFATYCHWGNGSTFMTWINVQVTYPVTGSTATAALSLPFNPTTNAGMPVTYDTATTAMAGLMNGGLSTMNLYAVASSAAPLQNVALTAKTFIFTGMYQSSS